MYEPQPQMKKQEKMSLIGEFILSILVDSSTVICWMSPFVILGVQGLYFAFILFLMENPVNKQC